MVRSRSKTKAAAKAAPRQRRRRQARAQTNETALAAFAHDIRTALTGILALGELLASSTIGDRERRWAASIKGSAEHLAALTTLVLDATKADAGSLALREEVFRPRRLLEALADSLTTRAETKGLTVEVTIADGLPELLVGDPVRLRAALENLIDNAVKFTERGVVRLDAHAAPAGRGRARLVVTVADSGIGLKADEIKRLFKPFVQASVEIARHYGGSGLGLAIVKRLARLMGGDLTVTSTPGRGSSFRFAAVLPIASAKAAARPRSRRAVPVRPLTILCAEDNPYGRVILNTILTELGHRADFVNSGEEAVASVGRGYDAVLMDVTLPGIDGLEATRRIRSLAGAAGRTPVIGITGRAEMGDEAAARAAGMDFYLRKPVSPSALSEAIAAAVRPPPRA
ncbi:MAG TPA: ATP-binding protein [Xanthobacteraceae bacterium]|nr:ATP-binding protein [Xanthobacteraceae bacterium]